MTIIDTNAPPGTLGGPPVGDLGGSTSNQLLPRIAPALLPPFISLALLTGGTSLPAHVELSGSSPSITYCRVVSRTSPEQLVNDQKAEREDEGLPELARSVRLLHRRSGLTWDELSRIFGVTRRTLYNWSIGGQVSASHAQALARVIRLVHEVEAGDAKATRSRLLAPAENGSTLYVKLIQQRAAVSSSFGPVYSPDQLLSARHDSPDMTGKVTDFEPLD